MPGPDDELLNIDDIPIMDLDDEPAAPARMRRTRRTVLPEIDITGTPEGTGTVRMPRGGRVERGANVDASLPLAPDPDTEARMRELAIDQPLVISARPDPERERRLELAREMEDTSALGDVARAINPLDDRGSRRAAARTRERLQNLWDEITLGDATLGGRDPLHPIIGRDRRSEAPIAGLAEAVTLGHPEVLDETMARLRAGGAREGIIESARAAAPIMRSIPGAPQALAPLAEELARTPHEAPGTYEEELAGMRDRAATAREQAPEAAAMGETAGQVAMTLVPGAAGRRGVALGAGIGGLAAHGASDVDITEDPLGAAAEIVPGALAGAAGAAAGQAGSRALGALGRGPADAATRQARLAAAREVAALPASARPSRLGTAVGKVVGGTTGAGLGGYLGGMANEIAGLAGAASGGAPAARLGGLVGGRAEQALRGLAARGRVAGLESLESIARAYPREAAAILGGPTAQRLIEGASSLPATSQAIPEDEEMPALDEIPIMDLDEEEQAR